MYNGMHSFMHNGWAKLNIKFKILNHLAKLPEMAHEGDAGLDLHCVEDIVIPAGKRASLPLGFALELPKGHVFLIKDKSGLALKHGITVLGGVIDSTYRGEVKVLLQNLGDEDKKFESGDKVAQALVMKIDDQIKSVPVTKLSSTVRGSKGFGSTGK